VFNLGELEETKGEAKGFALRGRGRKGNRKQALVGRQRKRPPFHGERSSCRLKRREKDGCLGRFPPERKGKFCSQKGGRPHLSLEKRREKSARSVERGKKRGHSPRLKGKEIPSAGGKAKKGKRRSQKTNHKRNRGGKEERKSPFSSLKKSMDALEEKRGTATYPPQKKERGLGLWRRQGGKRDTRKRHLVRAGNKKTAVSVLSPKGALIRRVGKKKRRRELLSCDGIGGKKRKEKGKVFSLVSKAPLCGQRRRGKRKKRKRLKRG